jgi:hypothetical protein
MGYGANYADVIEDKALDKIVKGKVTELVKSLEGDESDLESFARDIEYDDDFVEEEPFKKAEKIYHDIQKTFEKETGLEVYLGFHDSDNAGDRYDGVSGVYWYVQGMYELTPAGKKLEKVVSRQHFVTYG